MEGQLIEGKRIHVAGICPTTAAEAIDVALFERVIGGKLGDPERDFLPMMIFLASDGANYLTGQTYKIGGGLMLS